MSTVEGSSSGYTAIPYDYGTTEDKSSWSNRPPMFNGDPHTFS